MCTIDLAFVEDRAVSVAVRLCRCWSDLWFCTTTAFGRGSSSYCAGVSEGLEQTVDDYVLIFSLCSIKSWSIVLITEVFC